MLITRNCQKRILVFCWVCLLRICAEDHLVNFSPVSLVGLLLHIVADLLLLEVEGATVGVVDDGDFIDGKEAVRTLMSRKAC